MRRALASEWTKLRTVSSTAWLVAAAVGCTVLLSSAMAASVDTSQCPSPASCQEDTTRLALTGVWVGQVAVVVLAVLAVTSEYDTGMIQVTLAATPRRGTVLLAK
ncbi:MAG TPA: ABC transporter permease, partial [Actinomycetota bacterium]|nr:ABC transporter permease [Actinomycetota bacterium]